MSGPDGIPAAFRGRTAQTRSYVGLEDDRVLKIAASALQLASALPAGSLARARQWETFDAAMSELAGRAASYALARIRERRQRPAIGQAG